MKYRLFILYCSVLLSNYSYAQRVKYNFNPGWKVWVGDQTDASKKDFNDDSWKKITLPYAWNEVEVIDDKGNRCPTALDMINFSLDGVGVWRGGIAQGPDNYILAKSLPVEGGVNRVLIRSTTVPGTITLRANADGLKGATLSLVTTVFSVKDGLAAMLPAAGLPSNLERGPTPASTSYNITRIPVGIVKATAGAHADSAFASFDDNELSDWVNDGQLSTAWIEYELEREAIASEITLKLNNFRTSTYPLQITVDGKSVFEGTTATSLGYYTVKCIPQKGKKVRIQLASIVKDNKINIMPEVSGKKSDDGVTRKDAKTTGTLSIIEAEIYESISVK
ncbi:hypothetical protein SAMN05518672_11362 [Chitinophaga sp. CF118]|uniref:hypothetical protein n=1 Tax=Chitinophaga sp. CF118 TaxID=1884367 RepID=UPI0008E5905B|nr:hypothetical protein [Chitinophaga sp. CF118]SFE96531.1 hypothetical protein SAMN05518672_11362 [Chitinophaga sp. CF118]